MSKFVTIQKSSFSNAYSFSAELRELLINIKELLERLIEKKARSSDVVKLNIGGKIFSTLRQTLERKLNKFGDEYDFYAPNLFEDMLSGHASVIHDENEAIFIDRNPEHFSHVLDFMRLADSYKLPNSSDLLKSICRETIFYKVDALRDKIFAQFIMSSILSKREIVCLFETCDLLPQKWNLIYKASRDGFNQISFHKACDYAKPTLIIVKTSLNYIFGGCTSVNWENTDRNNGFKQDSKAFLFSLVNKLNKPVRIDVSDAKKAILTKKDYGPIFGDGDLVLFAPLVYPLMPVTFYDNYDRRNQIYSCSTVLGTSFVLNDEFLNETTIDTFLAGSKYFRPIEIEAFEVA